MPNLVEIHNNKITLTNTIMKVYLGAMVLPTFKVPTYNECVCIINMLHIGANCPQVLGTVPKLTALSPCAQRVTTALLTCPQS